VRTNIGRYNSARIYLVRIIENKNIFEREFATDRDHYLFLCMFDAIFKSNSSTNLKILAKDGTPDPDYEPLIQARKPLGIFADEL
jgi:hypothetical protein